MRANHHPGRCIVKPSPHARQRAHERLGNCPGPDWWLVLGRLCKGLTPTRVHLGRHGDEISDYRVRANSRDGAALELAVSIAWGPMCFVTISVASVTE